MFGHEVASLAAVIGELRGICKYRLKGEDRDEALALIDQAEAILTSPNGDSDQREKWREQKRARRAAVSADSPRVRELSADSSADTVEEEEEEVGVAGVEAPPSPATRTVSDRIDAVLATFNEVAGREAYRTGPHRSKAAAEKIGARMDEERIALDGDHDRAERRCCNVVRAYHDLWRNDPKMAPFIRPDTLFRPEKWADRVAEAGRWWEATGAGRERLAAITPDRAVAAAEWQDAYTRAHTNGATLEEAKAAANAAAPSVARA